MEARGLGLLGAPPRLNRRRPRYGRLVLSLALGVGLCGCDSAVSGWRSLTGVNKNDPDPQGAPFTANMAAAAQGAYPNLASVPSPPNVATSRAERQKLTDTLVAERGATAAAGAIPAISQAISPAISPASAQPATASASTAPALPAPSTATNAAAERQPAGAGGKQAANSPLPGAAGANSFGTTHRRQDEPPESVPRDSSLTMPAIPGPLPQPETAQPPPPPPVLPAVTAPAAAPAMPPAAVAAATPAPPPPVPVLPPIVPPPPPPKVELAKPAPAKTIVATLDVGAGDEPGAGERAEIDRIAALYKQAPRSVRIVAFAAAPANGADPLASYHAALERAQAVAKELSAAGIPSNKLQTEASPAAGAGSGRIEIQFLP